MNAITQTEIDTTARQLSAASALYYNGQESGVSDADWDALFDWMSKHAPNHPVLANIGATASSGSGWSKATHDFPLRSLNKAQNEGDLRKWWTECVPSLIQPTAIMEKLDGISVDLYYEEGKFVRACTRGDGLVGEDITRNVLRMKGVPTQVTLPGGLLFDGTGPEGYIEHPEFTGHIRGEIVVTHEDFANHFQGASNPRNSASGAAKRHSGQNCEHLTVMCYELTPCSFVQGQLVKHLLFTKTIELHTLDSLGFETPWWEACSAPEQVIDHHTRIAGSRDTIGYDIDGLVVCLNHNGPCESLGLRNKRPKGAIAYKFAHEALTTKLEDIVWQVGNTGRITPVAVFQSVSLAGANVRRASLHNVPNLERLWGTNLPCKGDEILVSRRNDVIPYLESVVTANGPFDNGQGALHVPDECPDCITTLIREGKYLVCPNTTGCQSQRVGSIKTWIKKVDLKGWGNTIVETLVKAGLVSNIAEIYDLDQHMLTHHHMAGRVVGPSTATQLLAELDSKMELPLNVFLGSLGMTLWSRSMFNHLMEAGYDTFDKVEDLVYRLEQGEVIPLPRIGATKEKALIDGWNRTFPMMCEILARGVSIADPVEAPAAVVAGGSMDGRIVIFTGFRDTDLQAAVMQAGGVIKSSMSSKVNLVVAKNVNSTSSKVKKARAAGVEIQSIDGLRASLGL